MQSGRADGRSDGRPLAVWALSDGRAGNVAQALGLAEAVGRQVEARVSAHALPPAALAALLPARAWDWLGRRLPSWPAAGLKRGVSMPGPPFPDLAIGAGRRAAPLVAALGRERGVATVQLLDPQMDLGAFDLVVAPEHDGLRASNALASLGALGRVTPARIAEAARALAVEAGRLPRPRLAVLIGGPGNMARWREEDVDRLVAALAALAVAGHGLMITTSRRTDPVVAAALARDLPAEAVLLHTGEGANPYPGMLGHAEAVLVTEDSVNMASEAASAGLPVHVFRVAYPSAKCRAFHAALAARGIARDFDGRIGAWDYPPLAEADRIAGLVLERLGPKLGLAGAGG